MSETLGEILLRLRKKSGLSRAKAAERAGISGTYLRLLESGERQNPSQDVLTKLCQAYELSSDGRRSLYTAANIALDIQPLLMNTGAIGPKAAHNTPRSLNPVITTLPRGSHIIRVCGTFPSDARDESIARSTRGALARGCQITFLLPRKPRPDVIWRPYITVHARLSIVEEREEIFIHLRRNLGMEDDSRQDTPQSVHVHTQSELIQFYWTPWCEVTILLVANQNGEIETRVGYASYEALTQKGVNERTLLRLGNEQEMAYLSALKHMPELGYLPL